MRRLTRLFASVGAIFVLLLMAAATPAAAQAVSTTDIQRLQDNLYTIATDISRLRVSEPQRADELQRELDNMRDEVTYLRVRLRKEGSVPRAEYADVQDRLDDLRMRVLGERGQGAMDTGEQGAVAGRPVPSTGRSVPAPSSNEPIPPGGSVPLPPVSDRDRPRPSTRSGQVIGDEIPAGQEIDVSLQQPLSSGTAQVEDRFTANTLVDVSRNGRLLIPAGSIVRGVVTGVQKATRLERKGSLSVAFDQITIRGATYPFHATVTQALESEGIRGEAGRIGAAAGVGAIIGGILGGVRGALAGVLIGGGGMVAATPGEDVKLPAGTVLRIRFDSPVVIER